MLTIDYKTRDGELKDYIPYLTKFLKIELNQSLTDKHEIAETILNILIGSRNIRQGKAPGIEIQANILRLIKTCMEQDTPIPVLVGSGPKKTDNNSSIDIAELSVLSILDCVNQEVKKFFKKGLEIKIRLEDLTGLWLEGTEAKPSMERYSKDFQILSEILDFKGISFFEESALVEPSKFIAFAEEFTKLFSDYLFETHYTDESKYAEATSYKNLVAVGWKGIVPKVMREYLMEKYAKLQPGLSEADYMYMVAKYLGATLARNKTNSTGKNPKMYMAEVEPMEIAFAHPTPGIPDGLQSARVYYRTLTLKNTKKDVPFWRARGILKVNKNGEVRYSLIGWSREESENVIPGYYFFSNGITGVIVNAGVIIED